MGKIRVREITLFAALGAMTFAAKWVMAALPNIEPVSLLVLLYGAVFGKKALYPVCVYVMLEILFYGLGVWNVMYLYIWPMLALAGMCVRSVRDRLPWAVLSGAFGLLFGVLCAPVDMVIGGFWYAVSKWVSGIPFDVIHSIGNFAVAMVLFVPVRNLLERLYYKGK